MYLLPNDALQSLTNLSVASKQLGKPLTGLPAAPGRASAGEYPNAVQACRILVWRVALRARACRSLTMSEPELLENRHGLAIAQRRKMRAI